MKSPYVQQGPNNNKTFQLARNCHFSFAGEPVVHWPRVRRPARDLLHDLGLLHPLQLRHVGHDAGAAGLETLGRLQRLVLLGAGGQQLAGAITHPDLMVDLLLDVAVLQRQEGTKNANLSCARTFKTVSEGMLRRPGPLKLCSRLLPGSLQQLLLLSSQQTGSQLVNRQRHLCLLSTGS